MAARVWGQPAGGFCSREDDGRPSDVDPMARDARTQMGWAAAELGRAKLRAGGLGRARARVGRTRERSACTWAACRFR